MNNKHLPKKIFLNRFSTCVFDKNTVRYGFVPYILDIGQKYDLSEYITDYLFDGQFPGKLQWEKGCVISSPVMPTTKLDFSCNS